MIDKKEIRFGNYVKDRSGKITKVDKIEGDRVGMQMFLEGHRIHGLTEYFEYLQPIPLTQEVLAKIAGGWDELYFTDSRVLIRINKSVVFADINSLHQLQNLYYAITGQELNYQP